MNMVRDVFIIRDHEQFRRKTIRFILLFFIAITLFNILIYRWNVKKIVIQSLMLTITYFPLLLLSIFIFYFKSKPVSIPMMIFTFITCLLTYLLILLIVEEYRPWAIGGFISASSFFLMELGILIYKRRRHGSLRG